MNNPIRVIEGTAKPHEPFWRFRDQAETESGEVELEFFGPISEYSWWGDEITPATFKKELYEKGGGNPVTVLFNSPGGEVIAASVIRSTLQEYPGRVTADIVGLAASAATIVMTGADRVLMRESAMLMIHDPAILAYGNTDELKAMIDILETVKDSVLDTYETKTKIDRAKLSKMMSDETWMTAREAKDYGFADEVITGSVKKASSMTRSAGFINCLSSYMHVPETLKDQFDDPVHPVVAQTEPSKEERQLRSKVQLLKGAK